MIVTTSWQCPLGLQGLSLFVEVIFN